MGCDGYIIDRNKPVTIQLICYDCGEVVDLSNPNKGHETCYSLSGRGDIAFDFSISNADWR